MRTVWIVGHSIGPIEWELQGVFTTRDKALAICGPDCTVVEFELDRDYTHETEFTVVTPESVAAEGAP